MSLWTTLNGSFRLVAVHAALGVALPACASLGGLGDGANDGGPDVAAAPEAGPGSRGDAEQDAGREARVDAAREAAVDARGTADADDATVGCSIGGQGFASGAADPASACLSCQPSASLTGWSNAVDGMPCGSGGICHTGACVSGCEIGGVYYATAAANPDNACESCQPGTSTSAWGVLADDTPCGGGAVCVGGACGTDCDIGGMVFPSGTVNPGNPCLSCQPATSSTQWSDVTNGMSCSAGDVCNAGSCVPGCSIVGTYWASGALNPNNPCQSCQPLTTPTSWSTVEAGTGCGTGKVCSGASCMAGCFIAGAYYPSGGLEPGVQCESCQPMISTTTWEQSANDATCSTGTCCAGACVNRQTDTSDCGTCGTFCAFGGSCSAGTCVCPAGQSTCGDTCVNLSNNGGNTYCGTCQSVCAGGYFCQNGTCVS